MISRINSEIEFMQALKDETKKIKSKNEEIIKQLENNINILNSLKSKKERRESSFNETSTAAKISSNKNHFAPQQQIESAKGNNNNNTSPNNINYNYNNNYDVDSSMTLEIETNLNLESLPSNDESLRFIDKVYDTKSNIKPIKNNFEEKKYYPPSASIPKEKTRKAQPIKVEKPLDYKTRYEQVEKNINKIIKEIDEKKIRIGDYKEKRKIIEEENVKKEQNLKHACTKIKIIQDQINVLKKQIEEFTKYKKKGINSINKEYSKIYSIYNIINNKNYYLTNINVNDTSDLNTLRK
jgi:hypothetical protein